MLRGFTTRDDPPGSPRGRRRFWRLASKWALASTLISLAACDECCPPPSADPIAQAFCAASETPPTPFKTPTIQCDLGSASSAFDCSFKANNASCTGSVWDSQSLDCTGTSCNLLFQALSSKFGNAKQMYATCGHPLSQKAAPAPAAWRSSDGLVAAAAARPSDYLVEATSSPKIDEFRVPQAASMPGPIIVAAGRVLFAQMAAGGTLETIDANGVITNLSLKGFGGGQFTGLAPDPSGSGACVGLAHISSLPDHIECFKFGEGVGFDVRYPLTVVGGLLAGLALGPDGQIWYTDALFNGVGRADINAFVNQANYVNSDVVVAPMAIVAGPDGAMWFTQSLGNKIARITTSTYDEIPVPTANSKPFGLAVGADGNLWFTEYSGNKIGRVTASSGTVTEFSLPTTGAGPVGIAAGPDGALWFTESDASQIGRITQSGNVSEYPVPTANSRPSGIVAGPDGNIWFTELKGNNIGRLTIPRSPRRRAVAH